MTSDNLDDCKMCGQLFEAVEQVVASDKFISWSDRSIPWFYRRTAEGLVKAASNSKTGKILLVGITGLAGSGKDTATNLVNRLEPCVRFFDKHGVNTSPSKDTSPVKTLKLLKQITPKNLSFATPLKKIAVAVGFTLQQVFDPKLKNKVDEFWGITPRQFLQMCGTEMFRNVWRDDVWVEIARKEIRTFTKSNARNYGVMFIPDVRFPNEAQMIKEEGGIVVRITRAGVRTMNHASENQVKTLPVDLEITNDCESASMWSAKFTIKLLEHFDPNLYWK